MESLTEPNRRQTPFPAQVRWLTHRDECGSAHSRRCHHSVSGTEKTLPRQRQATVNITYSDVRWLWGHQPLLATGLSASKVAGVLEISAYYDRDARRLVTGRHPDVRDHDTFISDQFAIDIRLNASDSNGWPKVYDIGMRHRKIAKRCGIPVDDLHVYPGGYACLGLTYPWDPPLTLQNFLTGMVEPFFYRLAYVGLYGLIASRADLWPEYSHGERARSEYQEDVRRYLRRHFRQVRKG